ncbi:putative quinol monooxygenase [Kordiimonas lipolytica]|uniref:Quinol monooxygenase n=1 Tax=Kordiimonas lipolytica TaxID=1662421 RepID=A0ABV8UD41_9PROT|nr:putative quinol monooxygenase [Kordiimonas lipolytica]
MLIVTGLIEISPEYRREATEAFEQFVRAARKELGNITYQMSEDIDMPGNFRFYEEWEAKEALARHLKSENTAKFRQALAGMQVLSINVKRYEATPVKL